MADARPSHTLFPQFNKSQVRPYTSTPYSIKYHSQMRAAVLAPTKALWGLNVLYTFKKIIFPYEILVEYGHPSLVMGYLFGHVLHRI